MNDGDSATDAQGSPSIVGIDLGGTGVRIVVTRGGPHPVAERVVSTRSFDNDPLVTLETEIRSLPAQVSPLAGIGIGASGPVELSTGVIRNQDTLPEFTNLNLGAHLARAFGVPVWIDNDAVAASLAEREWGIGVGQLSLLCVTLGTGVGVAGVGADGPVRAMDGEHPEAGHIPISGDGNNCYCGLSNCWEQSCSREKLNSLLKEHKNDGYDMYAKNLAEGLIALLTIYRPSAVSFSGSVSSHWTHIEDKLRVHLRASREYTSQLKLGVTSLGDLAGALGATLLVRDCIGHNSMP